MRAVLIFLLSASCFAAEPASTKLPDDLASYVEKQFGKDFKIAEKRTTSTVNYLKEQIEVWTPFLVTDIDGDGVEDAVIVTRSKSPLAGKDEFNYKVVDPYFEYHGYGDPKVTASMNSENPDEGHIVLVAHSWHEATPKAKYVIVNLPFDNLSVTKVKTRRKLVPALKLEMREMSASLLFLDGKKWKWRETSH